jgi:hypothetical protein
MSRAKWGLALLICAVGTAPASLAARGPARGRSAPAPGGLPLCAASVHEQHSVAGPDGFEYPTWHPRVDPETGCDFGHDHGSDPRTFVGLSWSGMPAFGYAAAVAAEPAELKAHPGFKVVVVNDDGLGKAWMAIVGAEAPHSGAVGRRGLELWMVRLADGALLAHVNVNVMADVRERETALDVGGVLKGRPAFSTGQAIRPQWVLRNNGSSSFFYTDAYGRRAAPGPGTIRQFVRKGASVDDSAGSNVARLGH